MSRFVTTNERAPTLMNVSSIRSASSTCATTTPLAWWALNLTANHGRSGFEDSGTSGDMQEMHGLKLLIDPPSLLCLWLVKEGCPFLGKRKPSKGLSFQACWLKVCPQRKEFKFNSSR